jgi:hypothetical protein
MMDAGMKLEEVKSILFSNENEINTALSGADWLRVFYSCICELKLDMRALMRYTLEPEEYLGRDFEKEMRDMFGGNSSITWQTFG